MRARRLAPTTFVLTTLTAALGLLPAPAWARPAPTRGPGTASQTAAPDPPLRPGPAYWLAGSDGGVFAFGRGAYAGGASDAALQRPVAGIAATPSGDGYWLATRDGGVFAFGDAPFLGSAAGLALHRPVIDVAATPSGRGYWLVAADGGVFAFGDAPWLGGVSGAALNQAVTAIVGTRTGQGYWLVGRDGGVFAFGDAPWLGGASALGLRGAVVDLAPTRSGAGYWLVAADGGVFAFGDAPFLGSALGVATRRPVVGIAAAPSGDGYWLAAGDGGVFAFGSAGFHGSAADAPLRGAVVGVAAGVGRAVPPPRSQLMSTFGWDISWPQCGRALPTGPHAFAIVGVTNGHAFSVNPCLAEQHRWSLRNGSLASVYVNVNWPSRAAEASLATFADGACEAADLGCQLHLWGYRGALDAIAAATARQVSSPLWWLDIETTNRWSPDTARNVLVIQGAIAALRDNGLGVGIYSTPYQWRIIAGGFSPGLPTWVAGPANAAQAPAACDPAASFGGGVPWMVQYPHEGFDGNLLCEAGAAHALRSFRVPPTPEVPQLPPPPPARPLQPRAV